MTETTENPTARELALRIDPIEVDHTMRWLRRRNVSPSTVSAVSCLAFTLLAAGGALLGGNFGSTQDAVQAWQDVKFLLPRTDGAIDSASFPFLRDFSSWTIIVGLSLYVGHVWHQFLLMSNVFPSLVAEGALEFPEETEAEAQEALRKARDRFESLRGSLLLPLLAWLAGAGVTAGAAKNGVFTRIVDGVASPASAYDSWWASVNNFGGYVAYVTIGIVSTYFILSSVLAAGILIRLAFDLRGVAEFRLNYAAPGDYGGWSAFYRLVGSVGRAVLLAIISLGAMALQLTAGSFVFAIVLLVLVAVTNPVFFFGPQLAVNRQLQGWCRDRRAKLAQAVQENTATPAQMAEFSFLGRQESLPQFRMPWRSIAENLLAGLILWFFLTGG